MLRELYDELKSFYETSSEVVDSGLVPKPANSGSSTYIFPIRDRGSCWHYLDANGQHVDISKDTVLRGTLVSVTSELKQSEKYGDSYKLKVTVNTTSGNYTIYCGLETAFGGGLLRSLAAYTTDDFKDICIGVTPSDQDEKVVFAQVCRGDGSWNKSLPRVEGDEITNLAFVQSMLGQQQEGPPADILF